MSNLLTGHSQGHPILPEALLQSALGLHHHSPAPQHQASCLTQEETPPRQALSDLSLGHQARVSVSVDPTLSILRLETSLLAQGQADTAAQRGYPSPPTPSTTRTGSHLLPPRAGTPAASSGRVGRAPGFQTLQR